MNGTISVADLCWKCGIIIARFYYWKDQLMKSAKKIFEDCGRKLDTDLRIIEKDREKNGVKDTIAEILTENLDLKKELVATG